MKGTEQAALSIEAERDHYRQHYSNMTPIVKEQQQQLAQYKIRCAGVDTLAVVLKEAKQESISLARQKKALETAVANLQNRLSTNGLSASVNIEETDMYVPGTSKQTLDNLARENARLRSLIKSSEHQPGKKQNEDVLKLKALVEDLESGKNRLQAQLREVEGIKINMVQQYEEVIATLKENTARERLELQQEITKCKKELEFLRKNSDMETHKDDFHHETRSVETQTGKLESEVVDSVRKRLKDFAAECKQLDEVLENLRLTPTDKDIAADDQNKEEPSVVTNAMYQEMCQRLQEVTLMNQRWQVHNDTRERQHSSNMAELKNEIDTWEQQSDIHRGENKRLAQIVEELQGQLNQLRQRPRIDPSDLDILKQQIQVCTEDFENERKDHEKEMKKNKSLQADVNMLKAELDRVKQERDNLIAQGQNNAPSQIRPRQPQPRHSWWGGKNTQQPDLPELPNFPPVSALTSSNSSRPNQTEATLPQATWQQAGRSTKYECEAVPTHLYYPAAGQSAYPVTASPTFTTSNIPLSQPTFEGEAGPSQLYALPSSNCNTRPESMQSNLPGGVGLPHLYQPMGLSNPQPFMSCSQPDLGPVPDGSTPTTDTMASMPAMRRRYSDSVGPKSEGTMSCFKCGKEFPDDQFIVHINECKD